MRQTLRRVLQAGRYACGMSNRRPRRVSPERRPEGIDSWAGMWVAVKDGAVIAAAHNSRDLVPMVRSQGPAGEGAVAQFVPHRTDDIMIGVG